MSDMHRPVAALFASRGAFCAARASASLGAICAARASAVRAAVAVVGAVAVSACGDGSGGGTDVDSPRAASIAVTPSEARISSLGDTARFTARITDQNGADFAATVAWSSGAPEVFAVSAQGVVTARANGSGTVTATFESVTGAAGVIVQQAPAAVVVVSGGGQEGLPGRALGEPVAVRVNDAGGSPVAGVAVAFAPAEGHGAADPAMADTDAEGVARTTWTLGPAAGVQSLAATAGEAAAAEVRAVAGELDPPADSAAYRVVFDATWSASTHPTSFPSGAHFSPLIGAVHNDAATFWKSGELATRGIEQMAETGATSRLREEIEAHIPGAARSVISGRGVGSPGSATISRVVASLDHPLITLVTMIAPSPDWFVGTAGLSMRDEFGQWRDQVKFVLYPYDSGTDSGPNYRSSNVDTSPPEPIKSLRGVSPFSDAQIGTYTFTRIDAAGSRHPRAGRTPG